MSDINARQVGGRHYKTSFEHWDWAIECSFGVAYLIMCATKYVSRWRKKNGIQDLEKALHYTDKLLTIPKLLYEEVDRRDVVQLKVLADKFAAANGLTPQEADYCHLMSSGVEGDIRQARTILLALIEQAKPVPLEDSNKHAERG